MEAAHYKQTGLDMAAEKPNEDLRFWDIDQGVLILRFSKGTGRVLGMTYFLCDERPKVNLITAQVRRGTSATVGKTQNDSLSFFQFLSSPVASRRPLMRNDECLMENGARFNSIEALKQAVKLGLGPAILPDSTITTEVANGSLVTVRLKPEPVRPLAAVYRKGKTLTAPIKQLIGILSGPIPTAAGLG